MATAVLRKTHFYRPELDALRFFAFFAVFVAHVLPPTAEGYTNHHVPRVVAELISSAVSAGIFGVPLFFLLSAFLIASLLLREKEQTGTLEVRAFYARRILRIWPLYFVFLAIAAAISLPHAAKFLLGCVFLSGNWMYVVYGPPATVAGPLWSVSVEEQFYLLWPMAARKLSRDGLAYLAIGLIAVANIARLLLCHTWEVKVWPNTFAHLDSIALGILCALFMSKPLDLKFWRVPLFLLGIALWMTCGHFRYSGSPLYITVGYPAMSLGALLLFLSVYGVPLKEGVLSYLGKISYGLYVWHALVLALLWDYVFKGKITAVTFVLHAVGGLLLTVGIAALSYRFLEAPFLQMKRRFTWVESRPV
jgi:peptidoglycan/LPS O-acetylase OafA/YrhL